MHCGREKRGQESTAARSTFTQTCMHVAIDTDVEKWDNLRFTFCQHVPELSAHSRYMDSPVAGLRFKAVQDQNARLQDDVRFLKKELTDANKELAVLQAENRRYSQALAAFVPDRNKLPTSAGGPNRGPIRAARAARELPGTETEYRTTEQEREK